MDFELNESQQKLVSMVRDFCVREVKPHATSWDRDERFPREVVAQLGELGLLGMTVPEEYATGLGGAGNIAADGFRNGISHVLLLSPE